MADVKRTGTRSERARQTRMRIVEAARDLFVERGYGATSLQDIAARAGVAVQTIYFVFGNKRTLLKELVDVTVAGDDQPLATMERPWFREAMAEPTAQAHLRRHVAGSGTVLARITPITGVISAAVSTDPDLAEMWRHDVDPRFVVQSAAAEAMMAKPGARPGVSAGHAADLLFAILGPELYRVLVLERRWPPQRWEEWAYETLRGQLCRS